MCPSGSLAYKLIALALILIVGMVSACGKVEKTPTPTDTVTPTASPAPTSTAIATLTPQPTLTPTPVLEPTISQTEYNITIDLLTSWTWEAQTFIIPGSGYIIKGASVNVSKVGSPPNALTVSIWATEGNGHPTGPALTSGTISASSVGISADFIDVTFNSPYPLSDNAKYALVIYSTDESRSNYYSWWIRNSDVFAGGNLEQSVDSGSTWTTQPFDTSFKLYLAPTSLVH